MSVLRVTSYLESEDSFKTSGLETLLTTTTTTINSTNTHITGTSDFSITSDAFNVDATETSIGTATISLSAASSLTFTSPLLTLSDTLFRVGTAEARFDTEQLNMTLGALPSTWTISDVDITGGLLTIHSGLTITNSVITINTTDINITTASIDTTVTDLDLNIVTLTCTSATSTLSLGTTTINAGTTTVNIGAATITTAALNLTTTGSTMQLGALNLTAGACAFNLGAINLTVGVITALAPITIGMAASALTVTTTSGAMALTVGSGAMTFTAGAGGILMTVAGGGLALTTGVGALALTTGAGIMQFTTGAGGINMNVAGGGISMITTVGSVKLSCGTGDAELSAAVGSCFIYAPVGGINVGKIAQRNGHFEVYTTNGATAAGTANIIFSTSSTAPNTGPGDFQVETQSAYRGDINLYGKGNIRLHTAAYVEIRTNNMNVLTLDSDAVSANYTWKFPADSGTAGQVLTSNGPSAAQTWTTPTIGTITSVTASSPLSSSGGSTPNISITSSTGSGAVVLQTSPTLTTPNIGAALGTSLQLSGLTASSAVATDASKNLVSVTNTGSGNNVLATSPTLVTPVLGAATGTSLQLSSLTASSALATDASKNLVSVTNTGSGNNVLATSPTLVTPVLGAATGTSLQLSSLTASSALATDASKNLVSVTNTGTGNNVLATSPTLVTPALGAATGSTLVLSGSITADNVILNTSGNLPINATGNIASFLTSQFKNSSSSASAYTQIALLNNLSDGLTIFQNSSNRTGDGAASSATVRNNISGSTLRLLAETGGITISSTSSTFNHGVVGTSLQLSGLSISSAVATDSSKNLVSVSNTGSGSNVLNTSPILISPNLGDATGFSLTLTNSPGSGNLTVAGTTTLSALTASTLIGANASKQLISISGTKIF